MLTLYYKIRPQPTSQASVDQIAQAFFKAQADLIPLEVYMEAVGSDNLWWRESDYIHIEGVNARLTLFGRHFLFLESAEQAARRLEKRLEIDLGRLTDLTEPDIDAKAAAGDIQWGTVCAARDLMQQTLTLLRDRPKQCTSCGQVGTVCCADSEHIICTDCCGPHPAESNPGSGYFVTGSR